LDFPRRSPFFSEGMTAFYVGIDIDFDFGIDEYLRNRQG